MSLFEVSGNADIVSEALASCAYFCGDRCPSVGSTGVSASCYRLFIGFSAKKP